MCKKIVSERSYLHEVDVRDGSRDIIVVFVRSVPDDDVAPGGEEAADERVVAHSPHTTGRGRTDVSQSDGVGQHVVTEIDG